MSLGPTFFRMAPHRSAPAGCSDGHLRAPAVADRHRSRALPRCWTSPVAAPTGSRSRRTSGSPSSGWSASSCSSARTRSRSSARSRSCAARSSRRSGERDAARPHVGADGVVRGVHVAAAAAARGHDPRDPRAPRGRDLQGAAGVGDDRGRRLGRPVTRALVRPRSGVLARRPHARGEGIAGWVRWREPVVLGSKAPSAEFARWYKDNRTISSAKAVHAAHDRRARDRRAERELHQPSDPFRDEHLELLKRVRRAPAAIIDRAEAVERLGLRAPARSRTTRSSRT